VGTIFESCVRIFQQHTPNGNMDQRSEQARPGKQDRDNGKYDHQQEGPRMKRVDEKLWKPIPEGGNRICCRKSVHLHVAFRAKIKYPFVSVLLYRPLCDAICTIVCLTSRTIPLCRSGRMIITKYFHIRAPFPCHRGSLQMRARSQPLQG